jgi:hypothetical protein
VGTPQVFFIEKLQNVRIIILEENHGKIYY